MGSGGVRSAAAKKRTSQRSARRADHAIAESMKRGIARATFAVNEGAMAMAAAKTPITKGGHASERSRIEPVIDMPVIDREKRICDRAGGQQRDPRRNGSRRRRRRR